MSRLKPSIVRLLACPMCCGELAVNDAYAHCNACGAEYPLGDDGQLDLRLRGRRDYRVDFRIEGDPTDIYAPKVGPIPVNPQATIDWRSIPLPACLQYGNRLTRVLLSYFPYVPSGGAMLDLGCGEEPFKHICANTKLDYVGMDYSGTAPILGNAESLPFKSNSFDFILSIAVFEHIRNPFVAMREVVRVLKPGGVFIGTVAFLEPFHLASYYHMTHLGTHHLLTDAGLEVKYLEPNVAWNALRALAEMSLFPRAGAMLSRLLIFPIEVLHRFWWKLGNMIWNRPSTSEQTRCIITTGGFRFVCVKL